MLKTNNATGLRWLWLAMIVFVFDFLTKTWVLNTFELYDSIELLPFFHFTYVRNYGAAFSALWGQRWLLVVVAIAVSGLLLSMLYRNSNGNKLNNIAICLILGGAIGNLFDRLYHGFVVDFLDFYIIQWRYPTFNFADVAIFCGAALMILDSFINNKEKPSVKSSQS